jgi:hypothetical protein
MALFLLPVIDMARFQVLSRTDRLGPDPLTAMVSGRCDGVKDEGEPDSSVLRMPA